jgi:sodium ion-translocating decarboxylase, beta subunit
MHILLDGLMAFTWQQAVMMFVGCVLMYLGIKRQYEPTLLVPMGLGTILVNFPMSGIITQHGGPEGIFNFLFDAGISTELFPLLIFIGIGAMIDFGPLLQNPFMMLFGAAAQLGIFLTVIAVIGLSAIGFLPEAMTFNLKEAASIGIIAAADGPTSIFVAGELAQSLLAPITVAAYSYMALVPIIQPPVIKFLTTKRERQIHMKYEPKAVSKTAKILFPLVITFVAGFVAPMSLPLIGFLMFGNILRECGVLDSLSNTAQNELVNIVGILLGLTISTKMTAHEFLNARTLLIIAFGLLGFVFDTAGGVLFAKLLNLFRKEKINPMVGAAGISAFPMSSRVIQKMATDEDPKNFILMHAAGANVSGQIASVVAGGLLLAFFR